MAEKTKIISSLAFRVWGIVFCMVLVSLVVFNFKNSSDLEKRFVALENQEIKKTVKNTEQVIVRQQDKIMKTAKDYGVWDETYDAIQAGNQNYFISNFTSWLPKVFGIDLIIVTDAQGTPVSLYGIDGSAAKKIMEQNGLAQMIGRDWDYSPEAVYPSGIIRYDNQLYYVGVSPVLHASRAGKANGLVLLADKITEDSLNSLSSDFGYDTLLKYYDGTYISSKMIPDSLQGKISLLSGDSTVFMNEDVIGVLKVKDLSDNPVAHLFVVESRENFLTAQKAITDNSMLLVIVVFIIMVVLGVPVWSVVTSPLKQIESKLSKMAQSGELERLKIKGGTHETRAIVQAFNSLIEALEMHVSEKESLRSAAITDSLTGLYNNGFFYDNFREHVVQGDKDMVLLFCDIDNFKQVNDAFGHIIGDQVLKRIGTSINEMSFSGVKAFRYGGEEIVITMTGYTIDQGSEFAEKLCNRIRSMDFTTSGAKNHKVTMSIGISHFPTDAVRAETLIAKADIAMYYAKKKGGDRWYIYGKEMEGEIERDFMHNHE